MNPSEHLSGQLAREASRSSGGESLLIVRRLSSRPGPGRGLARDRVGMRTPRAGRGGRARGGRLQLPREADPLGPLLQVPWTGRAGAQGVSPAGSQGGGVRRAALGPSRRRARQARKQRTGRADPQHRPEIPDAGARFGSLADRLRKGRARAMGGAGRRLEAALVADPAAAVRPCRRSGRRPGHAARSIGSCLPRSNRRASRPRARRRARRGCVA